MKSFVAAGVVVVLAGMGVATANGCGDSGGSGGGLSTSASTTSSATGSTSTGMGNCTELTPANFRRNFYDETTPAGIYLFDPGMQLGGPIVDDGSMELYDFAQNGKIDLSTGDQTNYGTCKACVLIYEDNDPMGPPAKVFFQSKGTLDLGTSTEPGIAGTLSDVTLVEVTVDDTTFTSTPVVGGACYHIANAQFMFTPPPAAWTCDAGFYDDKIACDCGSCGVADLDCSNASLPVAGCQDGQTCSMGACAGVPTAWTCAANKYNGGVGNGCDCDCGTHDPDCDLAGEAVANCMAASPKCNSLDKCVPGAWTCNPDYFGSADGCDCGCAVVDPDCTNATSAVCNNCDDAPGTGFTGSCDTVICTDAASKINATNNAVCN